MRRTVPFLARGEALTVSASPGSPDLAQRLNQLFDEVRPAGRGGRRYTNEDVAAAVKASNPEIRVGGAYLSALRNGTKRHPSTELLAALARHFGKPIGYFFDEPEPSGSSAADELARLADNAQVRRLALRALDLSPEGVSAVAKLVEQALQADRQGRPATRPDDSTAADGSDR
jgi:transcriptional regulator with XRE-family HTH domain